VKTERQSPRRAITEPPHGDPQPTHHVFPEELASVEQALSRVALLLAPESERVVAPIELGVVGRTE